MSDVAESNVVKVYTRNGEVVGATIDPKPEDAETIREAPDSGYIPIGIPQVTDLMDLAVARAIGVESAVLHEGKVLITSREWDELRGREHPTCEGDISCIPFSPSTDLNAAFAAAEKARLFDPDGHDAILGNGPPRGSWEVLWSTDDEDSATAPTPALAICTAILKLKERASWSPEPA